MTSSDAAQIEGVVVGADQLAVGRLSQTVPQPVGNLHVDEALVVVVARHVEEGRGIALHRVEVLAQGEVVAVPHDVGGHVAQMDGVDRAPGTTDLGRDVGQVPPAELRQVVLFGIAAQVRVGRDEEREVVVVDLAQLEVDAVDGAAGRVAEVAGDETVGCDFVSRRDGDEDIAAGLRRGHFVTAFGIGADDQIAVRDDDSGHGLALTGDVSLDGGSLCPGRACGAEGRDQKQVFHGSGFSWSEGPRATRRPLAAASEGWCHFARTHRICMAWLRYPRSSVSA